MFKVQVRYPRTINSMGGWGTESEHSSRKEAEREAAKLRRRVTLDVRIVDDPGNESDIPEWQRP